MFTVLELEPRVPTFREKVLHRKPPQPQLTRVAVKSGAPFFILHVAAPPDAIPWDTVFYTAGRCAARLLTAPDIVLPKSDRVRRFVPQFLPLRTALQTLSYILRLAKLPPKRLCIGVHDPNGALCGSAEILLRYAADVRIVTEKPDDYAAYSRSLLEQYGAGFTVDTLVSLFRGCNVLLCPDAQILPDDSAVRFSCTPAAGAFLLRGVPLPEPYAALLPDGIDPDLFAAALYELCGVHVLGTLCADCFAPDGTTLTPEDAAKRLTPHL